MAKQKLINHQLTFSNRWLILISLFTTERNKAMHTTVQIHLHPTVADPLQIFEIRRLARESGCTFVTSKPKQQARTAPTPFDPNGGGHAA
ncbi:hypothetical protein [Pseudomonas fluorescens]|uniref:hypothetical protein n=1 Tax=Pseudomonas fluorescens TaxID=294 RepID=UPI0012415E43|nr:hypothetical protein [Pseudomonas fluorescens]